jgi:pimeloyl-ACP methyl ester carboxylesterase
MDTAFAEVNGAQIFYRSAGVGHSETLLMIHAGICDSRMWETQIAHFATRYRVVALDLRGFGQSQMVEGAFTHHEDVLGLMDRLGIEKAWLLACSQGGKIALNIALMHPERVTGLLLVAPAIGGYRYQGAPHPLEDALEAAEDAGDLDLVSEIEVQIWVDAGRESTELDPAMRHLVWEMNRIPLQVQGSLWEQERPLEPPALERLEHIHHPTLLIVGDLDIPASLERVAILEQRIAGAKKVVMPNTAHVPNMEMPERFNQIVDEFLV